MLRANTSTSGDAAKRYFTESLSRGDYYSRGCEIPGVWNGKGAERLGLSGPVSQADFFALCENRRPMDGQPLTPRLKDNRRVGEDVNFHPPKSVSLVHALTGDPAILEAVRLSVRDTMRQLEERTQCRPTSTSDAGQGRRSHHPPQRRPTPVLGQNQLTGIVLDAPQPKDLHERWGIREPQQCRRCAC
jgi:hypothetical protein